MSEPDVIMDFHCCILHCDNKNNQECEGGVECEIIRCKYFPEITNNSDNLTS
jgi:hypothetical protein